MTTLAVRAPPVPVPVRLDHVLLRRAFLVMGRGAGDVCAVHPRSGRVRRRRLRALAGPAHRRHPHAACRRGLLSDLAVAPGLRPHPGQRDRWRGNGARPLRALGGRRLLVHAGQHRRPGPRHPGRAGQRTAAVATPRDGPSRLAAGRSLPVLSRLASGLERGTLHLRFHSRPRPADGAGGPHQVHRAAHAVRRRPVGRQGYRLPAGGRDGRAGDRVFRAAGRLPQRLHHSLHLGTRRSHPLDRDNQHRRCRRGHRARHPRVVLDVGEGGISRSRNGLRRFAERQDVAGHPPRLSRQPRGFGRRHRLEPGLLRPSEPTGLCRHLRLGDRRQARSRPSREVSANGAMRWGMSSSRASCSRTSQACRTPRSSCGWRAAMYPSKCARRRRSASATCPRTTPIWDFPACWRACS